MAEVFWIGRNPQAPLAIALCPRGGRALKDDLRAMAKSGVQTLVSMLEPEELIWLNCYHAHVLAKIGPSLDGADLDWLGRACAPL